MLQAPNTDWTYQTVMICVSGTLPMPPKNQASRRKLLLVQAIELGPFYWCHTAAVSAREEEIVPGSGQETAGVHHAGRTRMNRSRSRSLWCVTKGRAVAPPAIMFMHGVSTCAPTQVSLVECCIHVVKQASTGQHLLCRGSPPGIRGCQSIA
jgi:hypothetical protein